MTCIIGYIDSATETVYMVGDSAATGGYHITVRKDPKVFKSGPFVIGFTTSFRMGQILMSSKFKPSRQNYGQSDYDYMITTFIDEVRKVFHENGYNEGGSFLVGYRGRLYTIDSDFQVGESSDNFDSVGCGEAYAKGALSAVIDHRVPIKKQDIQRALYHVMSIVTHHSTGVLPPYIMASIHAVQLNLI